MCGPALVSRCRGQRAFVERRREAISAKGDPLETIKKIVPWEDFRADIEGVTETKPEERKSNACRRMDHSGGTLWQIGSEVPVPAIRVARDIATFGSARAPIVIFRVSQSERANMLPCHKTSQCARQNWPASQQRLIEREQPMHLGRAFL